MACFLVPGAEAVVATAVERAVASKEESSGAAARRRAEGGVTWKAKLRWLTTMLWGGAILLGLEHVWHGEVVFYPPFLTAMSRARPTRPPCCMK